VSSTKLQKVFFACFKCKVEDKTDHHWRTKNKNKKNSVNKQSHKELSYITCVCIELLQIFLGSHNTNIHGIVHPTSNRMERISIGAILNPMLLRILAVNSIYLFIYLFISMVIHFPCNVWNKKDLCHFKEQKSIRKMLSMNVLKFDSLIIL
jgi:hypothetical protein